MASRRQVVVVGGGPVGVALAVDLAQRGVTCTVVERRPALTRVPKGQGLSQRSMELMHRWGVADDLRAERLLPPDHPIGQVTAYGDLMSRHWHAAAARELVAPYYAERNERLPQYLTEAVLRRRLGQLPGAELLVGVRATDVTQDPDGVRVAVEHEDGTTRVLAADYVVGCDGGRSLVRERADIARTGTDFDELVALVVFRSPELHEALARFPDRSTFRVMHPDLQGYWMFFGRVDVEGEFFFHAPVPRGAAEEADVVALMHRAAGLEFACEIDHVGFWDLRVQVATEYRAGRALIAGDAAHTHPPYGGFGLNNGLEDAANLGWKLAAVLGGWGGDALLESYGLERQPIFRDVGEDVIGGWIRDDRAFLERFRPEDDPEEFERRFVEAAEGFGRRLRDFEPHYEGSPVVLGPAGGRTSAHGEHTFAARPGHHLPPHVVAGSSVLDALGPDFTLLALDADPADVDAFSAAAAGAGVPLAVVRDSRADGRERWGARLVLVRPDQFVAWCGDAAPDDVPALLLRTTGRGRPGAPVR